MRDGFVRVASATPSIGVADCARNAKEISRLALEAALNGASAVVFPELCITGYTCGDLFLQSALLKAAENALLEIAAETASAECLLVIGMPLRVGGGLYNAAAVLFKGAVLGFVPKTHLPNYGEFSEVRWFTPAGASRDIEFAGNAVPFGTDLLFCCSELPEFCVGVEICEDLWVPSPPSSTLCACGATVICNPSASDEIIGKDEFRRSLVTVQSSRSLCAYVYADAGEGESTTDLVFAGHDLIAEDGVILAESKPFTTGLIYADIDVARIAYERSRMNTFPKLEAGRVIRFDMPLKPLQLERHFAPMPFVPENCTLRECRCGDILALQAEGLAARLRHTRCERAVIGLSGGLDSTLALLVAVHSFDRLNLPRTNISAITMPCFGTTGRTKTNAHKLAEACGVPLREIDIKESVELHLRDIEKGDELDAAYENAQARERTQILMDIANYTGAMVVGTGDLSELALGWATYNGDHMSMYSVNASVPKTLVRHLVEYESEHGSPALSEVLKDILDTPVSPELLPPKDGEIAQRTEELVGPYELHDFFLYYLVRAGYSPKKIFRIAQHAFEGVYDAAIIKKWLVVFCRRFFSQQFKRSCMPDGPKVGTVSLSPRGDWRMPSDASSRIWLEEAESLQA